MKRLKQLWAVIRLPDWLAFFVVIPSFVFVIHTLSSGRTDTSAAYASYALSAYALILLLARIPGILRAFRTDFCSHPLLLRILQAGPVQRLRLDRTYRAQAALCISLAVNLLNASIHAASGLMYRSVWFGTLAAYYLLLVLMRLELVRCAVRRSAHARQEWRLHQFCGAALLAISLTLAVIIAMLMRREGSFAYPGIMIYVMALYAFYSLTSAAVYLLKNRRRTAPLPSAAGNIRFCAALISMLALEAAMLEQFSSENQLLFCRFMIASSGLAVFILILIVSIRMLLRAASALNNLFRGESP